MSCPLHWDQGPASATHPCRPDCRGFQQTPCLLGHQAEMAPAGPQGEALICKWGVEGRRALLTPGWVGKGPDPKSKMASSTQPSIGPATAQPRPGGEVAPSLPCTGRQHRPISGYTLAGWPSVTFTVPGRHVNHVPSPEITHPVGLRKPICPVGLCARFWVRPAEEGGTGGPGVAHSQTAHRRTQRALPSGSCRLPGRGPSPSAAHHSCGPGLPVHLLCLHSPGSRFHLGVQPHPLCVPSTPHLTLQPPPRSGANCCGPALPGPTLHLRSLTHLGSLSGQSAPRAGHVPHVSAVALTLKPAACPSARGSWPVTHLAGLKSLKTNQLKPGQEKGDYVPSWTSHTRRPGPPRKGPRAPEASWGGPPHGKRHLCPGGVGGRIPLSPPHCLHVQTGNSRAETLAFLGLRRPVPPPGGLQDSQCPPEVHRALTGGRGLGLLGRWEAGSKQGSAPGLQSPPPYLSDHGPQGMPGAL